MNAFALAGLLVGCASWVDGTWLFAIDQDVKLTGTCAEDDIQTDDKDIGDVYMLIDIYEADDGNVVVFFDELLEGPRDGSSFTADWEAQVTYDDGSGQSAGMEMDGTKEAGLLVGTLRNSRSVTDPDGVQTSCNFVYDFTAELVTSDDSDFVGD